MACYCNYTSFSYNSGVKYVVQLLYTYRKGSFTGLAHLRLKWDIFGKMSFFCFCFLLVQWFLALQFRSSSMCVLSNWISEILSTHFLQMKIGFKCIFLFLLSNIPLCGLDGVEDQVVISTPCNQLLHLILINKLIIP